MKRKESNQSVPKKNVMFIAHAAIIAALYVVIMLIWPLNSSAIQVRLSEALTVLPFFTPAAIPGVTIGCLLGNFLSGSLIYDVIFGTIATLIGAIGSYLLRKNKFLVPLPPILANTIIIPFVLRFAYGLEDSIPYLMLTVGIGEVISCGILGIILLFALNKHKNIIFKHTIPNA